MTKRTMILICSCFVFSVLTIIGLYLVSDRINHSPNGFIRLFPSHFVTNGNKLDIKYSSFYISGFTSKSIYLGNYMVPNNILICNYNLDDTQFVRLSMLPDRKVAKEGVHVTIDSPHLYVIDRITASFMSWKMGTADTTYDKLDTTEFSASIPLSPGSAIIRTYNRKLQQNILSKITVNAQNKTGSNYILEKQQDGLFSVDGSLQYDPEIARLVYVYYYRNQFVCLDTNLNVLYKSHTIDTITKARIKISEIGPGGATTFSAPPLVVNKKSSVSGHLLFINSGLTANNENKNNFDNNSVIDIYSLVDGRYKFSFYLPDYNNEKMAGFAVHGKTLATLYDHFLVLYQLDL